VPDCVVMMERLNAAIGVALALAVGACGTSKGVDSPNDTTGSDSSASTSSESGSANSGEPQTGSATTGGPAPAWVTGTYFAGELGAPSNGTLELTLAEDGTFTMMAADCDFGVGSQGTWTEDADGVSLLGPDAEALWFFEEPLTSLHLSPGADCNELVAAIVDADGQPREELLHRGVVCPTHLDHCTQKDPLPDPLPEPGLLEYCEEPPPACE